MSNLYIYRASTDTRINFEYDTYLFDATNNNINITISSNSSNGVNFMISRIDNSTNTLTITAESAQINNRSDPVVLDKQLNMQLVFYNNNWFTILGAYPVFTGLELTVPLLNIPIISTNDNNISILGIKI